ncbi:cupredoxin family copper-binding protein [Mycolicibacterium porcinum]|uniref:Cupredoxin family copper-binding protein n=1 Tax=Mycolicibacterium porcinum TaxID=39693 RepID=A0ABV3V7T7_9MYCO
MVRRFPASAVAVALVATATACSHPPSAAPPPMPDMAPMSTAAPASPAPAPVVVGTAVSIDNFAFTPATLTVHRGDTVTWTNHDEEPHTVAAGDGSFRSPGMDANATFSFTFTNPGSYDYICSIHPVMRGTVVVTP